MEFEKEMARLKEISEKMSEAGISLDDSMKLYTEAVALSKQLGDYIENAKLKIEQLEGD